QRRLPRGASPPWQEGCERSLALSLKDDLYQAWEQVPVHETSRRVDLEFIELEHGWELILLPATDNLQRHAPGPNVLSETRAISCPPGYTTISGPFAEITYSCTSPGAAGIEICCGPVKMAGFPGETGAAYTSKSRQE